MKKVLLYSVVFFFVSCGSQTETVSIVDFSPIEKKELPEKVLKISESCYSDCFILDSLLVLVANCDSSFFHVYNKYNLELIMKFGSEGEAPHDFLRPISYNTNYLAEQGLMNFYDIHSKYNKEIDFKSIISGEKLADCIQAKPVDQALLSCHEINFISENSIAMRSVEEADGMFMLYNPKTEKKNWIEYYPKMKDVEDKFMQYVYYGLVHANPKKNTIAFFYRYLDGILFFDLNGNRKADYFFSEVEKPAMSNKYVGVSNESTLYSIRVCSTPNYCFVVRANQPFAAIKENPKLPIHLLKFNWEGELLNIYEFSVFPYLYTVDEETETIYIINQNRDIEDPYVEILKFPM